MLASPTSAHSLDSSKHPTATTLTSPLLSFAGDGNPSSSSSPSSSPSSSSSSSSSTSIQSLDFERIINSYHLSTHSQSPSKSKRFIIGYSGRTSTRWFLTLVTGTLIGLIAVLIVNCISFLIELRESSINNLETSPIFTDEPNVLLFAVFSFWNVSLAIAASLLCVVVSPSAAGSGIPEVKAYLNGVRVPSFLNSRTFFAKTLGTILAVSSGLCVGPEGPLVHLGAMVGSSLTRSGKIAGEVRRFRRGFPRLSGVLGCASPNEEEDEEGEEGFNPSKNSSKKDGWRWPKFSFITSLVSYLSNFRNDGERRDLISIGAAAGFAAAFGAPIGGVLFSLEEASTFFASKMLWRTLMATAVATFVIASYYGDLTHYGVLTLDTINTPNDNVILNRFQEVPLYVIIGVMGGLLGAFFNHAYHFLSMKRKEFYSGHGKKNIAKLGEVICLSLLTSFLTFYLSLSADWACRDIDMSKLSGVDDDNGGGDNMNTDDDVDMLVDDGFGHRFNCGVNQTNELASVLFGNREDAIKNILLDPTAFDEKTLITVGVLFYCLLILTFGATLPSGIFMPLILIGSSLGGYSGILIDRYIMAGVSPSTFALVGVASILGGVQRSTVSLCVILMEGTGQIKFLIPIVITTVCARTVGDYFNEGVYELGMELKNLPYLDHHVHQKYDLAKIGHFCSRNVITLGMISKVEEVAAVLNGCNHHGFPVVDNFGKYVGMVRRDQLAALIECGIFVEELEELDIEQDRDIDIHMEGNDKSFEFGGNDRRTFDSGFLDSSIVGNNNNTSKSFDGGADTNCSSQKSPNRRKQQSFVSNRKATAVFQGNSCDFKTLTRNATSMTPVKFKKKRNQNSNSHNNNNNEKETRNSELMDEALLIKDDRYKSNALKAGTKAGIIVIEVSEESLNKHVDIGAVMNLAPHVVLENCPLSRAYKLFSSLGLRHLVVLGGVSGGEIVGLVTRANLLEENIREKLEKNS